MDAHPFQLLMQEGAKKSIHLYQSYAGIHKIKIQAEVPAFMQLKYSITTSTADICQFYCRFLCVLFT